jgi:hypothetical protein
MLFTYRNVKPGVSTLHTCYGVIRANRPEGLRPAHYTHSASTQPGASGAALYQRNTVVGIHLGTEDLEEQLNRAVGLEPLARKRIGTGDIMGAHFESDYSSGVVSQYGDMDDWEDWDEADDQDEYDHPGDGEGMDGVLLKLGRRAKRKQVNSKRAYHEATDIPEIEVDFPPPGSQSEVSSAPQGPAPSKVESDLNAALLAAVERVELLQKRLERVEELERSQRYESALEALKFKNVRDPPQDFLTAPLRANARGGALAPSASRSELSRSTTSTLPRGRSKKRTRGLRTQAPSSSEVSKTSSEGAKASKHAKTSSKKRPGSSQA